MGAFKNIHMDQQAMTAAINIIRTDMADHLNEGFPLEAYGAARVTAALIAHDIDPFDLGFTAGELIRVAFAQRCLEALAA
ncbi:hypothetical protein [Microvirga lotononidis]|uniref:Uncharacterized protein n=1 Tax=Microvirga lotononidis TaxID=864069 RepID=I4YP18_9HYPH|nr:hypothetical protein [Microvirga lotononidis]EIM25710.1 hypothetical protein MicloDRAFT_00064370 [Microvirga lotononidis]WQO25646.1 hypothetical protein U0023_13060 [Microvirga lotononidis]